MFRLAWLFLFLLFAPLSAPLLAQNDNGTPNANAANPNANPNTNATKSAAPIPRFTPESELRKVIQNVKEAPTPERVPPPPAEVPSLIVQGIAITLLAISPFLVMLLSPFMKIVVVLSLLRTALGVQNSPPNAVINGIAIILSIFIMYPVATKMYDAARPVIEQTKAPESIVSLGTAQYFFEIANASKEPFRDFLKRNSLVAHERMFYQMVYRHVPENERKGLSPTDFIVLIPSYITSQLKAAFEIGVLIYVPFFVVDMVVSNILLAMGMMMLSPVTISMPLKLFLLVMLDGWSVLIEGLVQTYRTGVA